MSLEEIKRIGLIAGQGELPCQIIAHCQKQGIEVFALAFEGQTPLQTVANIPHTFVKLGAIGKALDFFHSEGIKDVVFAGAIRRPSLSELSLDWTGTRWLAKIGLNSLGDDGVLKAIIALMADEGFRVHGANDILSEIFALPGCLTALHPTADDLNDITKGTAILKQLGDLDIGQALVIQQGLVLGIEAIEGTAGLIERVSLYKRQGRGPILVKMTKPNQTTKIDLPTIGTDTIRQAHGCGFAGIAIESQRTQILSYSNTIDTANQLGVFIYSI